MPDPNDPCDYAFDPQASYVTHLAVASLAEATGADGKPADHCCFDQNSDGVTDNRLGEIVSTLQGLPQITRKINEVIAANVADGTITVLLELVGLSNLTSVSGVTLNAFYGSDADGDATNNATGASAFYVDADSFTAGTAEPRVHFTDVTVTNGNLFAGPSVFRLEIPLANGLAVSADIRNARVEGKIAAGPHGGVAVDGATPDGAGGTYGAKLGGVIHQDDLFGAFNTFVDRFCACLAVPGGADVLVKSGDAWTCSSNVDKSSCDPNDEAQAQCRTLVDVCGLALTLITPDIDSDSSGSPDAFSVGFWVKATGAVLQDVNPTACTVTP